jgi:hypothetical protein
LTVTYLINVDPSARKTIERAHSKTLSDDCSYKKILGGTAAAVTNLVIPAQGGGNGVEVVQQPADRKPVISESVAGELEHKVMTTPSEN